MGTVSIPGVLTDIIQGPVGVDVTISGTTFPVTDSTPRSTATFGGINAFSSKSERQEVLTATATIATGITIVGVNFNGAVTLTFADPGVDVSDIYVVDEGGFASATNTITATSTSPVSGDLIISNPYTSMHIRGNATGWFSEYSNTVINPDGSSETIEPDGSTTIVSADGTTENTSADGLTVFTTNPDGSTILDVAQADGKLQTTTTVLADGTTILNTEDNKGVTTTNTTYPDGSTLAETGDPPDSTSFFTAVDGTTTDIMTTNGDVDQIVTSPDGTVTSTGLATDGTNYLYIVNPDGSSSTYDEDGGNGDINEVVTSIDGSTVSTG